MRERNQLLRTLQAEYLRLRWKINKYEKFESMLGEKHGKVFGERIKRRLEGFRELQSKYWDRIVEVSREE